MYEVFLPPLKIFEGNGENMQIFYRVETFKYAAGNLVDPSHIDYQSFNLTTRKQEYKFHRSPRGVETLAKINYAPYTNQWIDENNRKYIPQIGNAGCGPTSLVMGASSVGKIPQTDYKSLRSYVYEDNIWSQNGLILTNKSCDSLQGAIARTISNCNWKDANWQNMYNLMVGTLKYGQQSINHWDNVESKYSEIKNIIDSGKRIVSGVGVPAQDILKDAIGHVMLIKGYGVESDNQWNSMNIPNSMIVNDSFTDLTIDENNDGWVDRTVSWTCTHPKTLEPDTCWGPDYTHLGNGAIYKIGVNSLYIGNYLLM